MFSRAFEKATAFTHPVLFGIQRMDGTTAGGCGSYVMLNEDGWALTAAHVVEPLWWNEVNREKILQFEKEWTEVENNPRNSSINKKMVELKKLLSKFKFGGDEAKSCNFYWGEKGRIIESCIMHDSADLALLKFKSSDQDYITNYPVIKKPTSLIGTMLCRIGFPFVTVDVKENEGNQILFNIRDGKEPRHYPTIGLVSRICEAPSPLFPEKMGLYLETVPTGLPGQSGGPVVDSEGNLWGICSQTQSIPLEDLSQEKKNKGKKETGGHCYDVGLIVHPQAIIQFLDDNKIIYKSSST